MSINPNHPAPLTTDELTPAANGGLLDRRIFLKRGLVFASAVIAGEIALADDKLAVVDPAAPPWMREPGQPFSTYSRPSPYEKRIIRSITANKIVAGNGASWTPLQHLEGMVTPTGLHFERHHNGVPQIDPGQHQLLIHGLVQRPLTFRMDDLTRYPMRSHLIFLECGGNSNSGWFEEAPQATVGNMHGLVSCSEWSGVPLAILLDEAGIEAKATWIVAEGADAIAMNVSLPLEKIMDDCIVAIYQNGEKLRPEHDYPLRLIAPGWEGVLNVKWLRRIQVTNRPMMARNETSKYTELMPDGKTRQFTFIIDAKSLITTPSHGQALRGAGVYEIRGLAWSGRGKIKKVEVSADGGATWAEAALQEPVLSRCFTRFRIPWNWNGGPAVLKSRATDEAGYVQPERKVLIAERGRNGYFHYNAVVSWSVDEDGSVSHVY